MSEVMDTETGEAEGRRYSHDHVEAIRARFERVADGFERVNELADEILAEMGE